MKNKHLIQVMRWIGVPLHGDLARKRNRIAVALNPAYDELNKKRLELLEKHAEKGEDGKAIIESGNYKLTEAGTEAFNADYEPIYETETDALESLGKDEKKALKEILSDKLTVAFDIPQGAIYDEVLTFLESK